MRIFSMMLALTLLIGACGDEGGGSDVGSGIGPGISVSEAVEGDVEGPVLVNGYLFVEADGEMILADAIAESYPPQPGGATLVVEGLDLGEVEDLQSDQGRNWTDDRIQVLGTVQDGKLVVGPAMSG